MTICHISESKKILDSNFIQIGHLLLALLVVELFLLATGNFNHSIDEINHDQLEQVLQVATLNNSPELCASIA